MKFIYKNDKEKQRFLENYERMLLLYNKIMLFGENYKEVNSSRSSQSEKKRINNMIRQDSECKMDLVKLKFLRRKRHWFLLICTGYCCS